jgi:hypothetical protein
VVKGVEVKPVIDTLVALLNPPIYRIPIVVGHNPMLAPFAAGNGKDSPSPSRVRFSRTGQSRFYRAGGEVS